MERIDMAEIDTQRPRKNPAEVERELDDLLKQQGIRERKLPSPERRISLEHLRKPSEDGTIPGLTLRRPT